MISSQQSDNKTLGTLEITPLIDIVFIVIVFLLITANSPLLSLPIDVPSTDNESILSTEAQDNLTVTISASLPQWHIEKSTYENWAEFKMALTSKTTHHNNYSGTSITIAVDKKVPSEMLLKLLAFLNERNMTNANIIMQPENF